MIIILKDKGIRSFSNFFESLQFFYSFGIKKKKEHKNYRNNKNKNGPGTPGRYLEAMYQGAA